MRKVKYAFTMIELIFVIVIIGILSKFGIEFLAQAYQSFIFSKVNNTLQAQSEVAVESIASRLQFRIKDSIIARDTVAPIIIPSFQGIQSASTHLNSDQYNMLEWVGYDIDGLRGDANATWSGIIDLKPSTSTSLITHATSKNDLNSTIATLSAGNSNNGSASVSSIDDTAIYFIGSDSNVLTGYGWNGTALSDQNGSVMHPIKMTANNIFVSSNGDDFNQTDVYEYYQLAWTAYAVVLEGSDLFLYYDYQPWNGQKYSDTNITSKTLLMENVDTFRFKAVGSVVKIQVCVFSTIISGDKNDDIGGYSLCKEKTIF